MNLGNDLRNDLNVKSKEYSNMMRSANFKMGSILPESNNYKVSGLERIASKGSNIGLTKTSSNFKPARNSAHKSQGISAGNNIARGSGMFKTVNQEMTNWI